ncbi:AMP-binding protein [Tardiphaga sp. OK245]|uniref:phenylacetate--CoA ligase family protein n=1 Tax=Tardiphaga sp. OK245 TaxID=1855306 RepID=UPI0008A7C7F5|nr:AMP-binding protein [Tardiphaga sp. OK245]SEH40693.1 Phenylacetate-coenzyme A ligase PaaK, adenylate-forming domain family [Tardiphaga sp. OK245]
MIAAKYNLAARVIEAVPNVLVDLTCPLRATSIQQLLRDRDDGRRAREDFPMNWDEIESTLSNPARFSIPLLSSSIDHLRSITPFDKTFLRSARDRIINEKALHHPLWVKTTSGTTGTPVEVLFDELHYFDYLLLTARRVALRANVFAAEQPSMFAIYISDNPISENELWLDPWGGGLLQWVTEAGSVEALNAVVNLVRCLRPDAISLRPSLLEFLLEFASSDDLFSGYCGAAIVSGANLDPALKARSAICLGTPIIEAYGLTEFGIVASECNKRNGMHFDPDILVEVLDDSGELLDDGHVGHIVLTSLRNEVMPFVRYRTGDLGRISRAICTCGRVTPRLIEVEGRTVQNFRLLSGKLVSPTRFNQLFEIAQISEFQLTQRGLNEFHLQVELHHNVDACSDQLASFVEEKLGESAEITVAFGPVKLPGAKFERFRVEFGGSV